MTTADEIMVRALKKADDEYKQTRIRLHAVEDRPFSFTFQPQNDPAGIKLSPEQARARRGRSIAIALALGAFALVIFAVTMVRLGSGVLQTPQYMRPVQTTK